MTVTLLPRRRNSWLNSTPIYPPPMIKRCSGTSSISMIVVELRAGTASSPGIGGFQGRDPVSMKNQPAESSRCPPSTSFIPTDFGPVKLASPIMTSTPPALMASRLASRKSSTMLLLRCLTAFMSIETRPASTPYSRARLARYATRPLATMVFVGVQPSLIQVPPM